METRIHVAQFIKGIRGTDEILVDGKPHFAFIGRSNVGKSSVINSLLGTKKLVRSSSTPGQTREINFFLVNGDRYFVDLPGYGYAKISKDQREKLRKLIVWYLTYSGMKPACTVLILDAQVGATEFDIEIMEVLRDHGHRVIVLANKADKLTQKERAKQQKKICEKLGVDDFTFYSSKTNKGRENVLDRLFA